MERVAVKGLIFTIEEFAVFDGPGIRTAVFFKGCPLRCRWCHNPEGWLPQRQLVHNPNGCTECGKCREVCASRERCTLCGKCITACPRGLIRFSGDEWDADALAGRVKRNADALELAGGGVTLSGGEVLMQPEFLLELLEKLAPLHRAVETSGYGDPEVFSQMLELTELVLFDIKLMDCVLHEVYTGRPNDLVLRNAETLKASGVPFIVRIPLMAGVNDSEENMRAAAAFLEGVPNLLGVELLPYNTMAGAKYAMLGLWYENTFQPPGEEALNRAKSVFTQSGIHVTVR